MLAQRKKKVGRRIRGNGTRGAESQVAYAVSSRERCTMQAVKILLARARGGGEGVGARLGKDAREAFGIRQDFEVVEAWMSGV